MMNNPKSKIFKVLLILYTLLSVASTFYLLFKPEPEDNRLKETKQEIRQIRKYLKEKDAQYIHTIDSLLRQSDSLLSVIRSTDKKLVVSRSQVKVLSSQLNQYIHRYDTDSSLSKGPVEFDSLSGMSKDYIRESTIRDSLCDIEVGTLKQLVESKDAALKADSSILSDYKASNEQLTHTAEELALKLQKTEKSLKRKTFFNRAMATGGLFLSGFLLSKIL